MYTKQILGGWDLTESDFNSRQEWLTHCERSTKEYHEKEAARIASLDDKKAIESAALREKVLKFLVALESGEKITFANAMAHNGKLRIVNPKIGDIPLIWELFSVSGLSFCTKAYSEQDAQIIVDAFVNALAQAANVSNAKAVEVRDISKYAKAFDIIFFKPEDKTMCYQVEVLELQDDKAIITVGESKFIAYHDTEVNVEEGFDDCWDYARESHYTKSNGKHEVDARTILNSLHVITFEDDDTDERLDIHIPSDRISKDLKKAIEDAISLDAINEKEQELENAANFDWSVGHVSHYYI